MENTKINITVNILIGIFFLFSLISGLVLKFGLPAMSGAMQSGARVFNLTRLQWLGIHGRISIIFSFLIIIHLFLH